MKSGNSIRKKTELRERFMRYALTHAQGGRIPTVAEFRKALGVSNYMLLNCMNELTREGVIYKKSRKEGTFLTRGKTRSVIGLIIEHGRENEYVNTGKNILRLENPDSLEISCFASAVYYTQVIPGKTKVEILDPNSGKILGNAVVTYRAPGVDPESRTFELKVTVPQNIKLVSGMLCELNVILLEKEAFGIPADAALLRANDRYIVFTVGKDNRARSIEVSRGIVDKNYCEILNPGELAGKQIVVTGQTFVNNNALLQIINPDKPPAAN